MSRRETTRERERETRTQAWGPFVVRDVKTRPLEVQSDPNTPTERFRWVFFPTRARSLSRKRVCKVRVSDSPAQTRERERERALDDDGVFLERNAAHARTAHLSRVGQIYISQREREIGPRTSLLRHKTLRCPKTRRIFRDAEEPRARAARALRTRVKPVLFASLSTRAPLRHRESTASAACGPAFGERGIQLSLLLFRKQQSSSSPERLCVVGVF